MKATENPIRIATQALIESHPGIPRRELTKRLKDLGYRIDSKSLSATLRRMRYEGQIYHTGQPMRYAYWPSEQETQQVLEVDHEVIRVMRPAAPSDFNYPMYASPLQWSMAHLLGA